MIVNDRNCIEQYGIETMEDVIDYLAELDPEPETDYAGDAEFIRQETQKLIEVAGK